MRTTDARSTERFGCRKQIVQLNSRPPATALNTDGINPRQRQLFVVEVVCRAGLGDRNRRLPGHAPPSLMTEHRKPYRSPIGDYIRLGLYSRSVFIVTTLASCAWMAATVAAGMLQRSTLWPLSLSFERAVLDIKAWP